MGSAERRMVIAGNWKMHKTIAEALGLVEELKERLAGVSSKADVVVAPPFTALASVVRALEGAPVRVAAQNCYWEQSGAFTGEISPPMLKELGCSFVIVGHSERRQLFGETDETVNRRARAALDSRLLAIICVGETLTERDDGRTLSVVTRQVEGALSGLSLEQMAHVVLAYEPVWAIGTGRNATPEEAQEVHAHIREELTRLYGRSLARAVRVQYGGSVKPENARELLRQPDIDGALVGGASLKSADFAAIVEAAG
jgi:triosephosphate isomerase